ncbi:MAG: autotransporter outer membrane beta-barrel domain-containing protein, partial [Gemmatimonadales bacterium]
VCSGLASFADGAVQVLGAAAFNDDASTVGGALALGGSGAYGRFAMGSTTFDDLDRSSLYLVGNAGYQLSLDQNDMVYLCPTATVAFSSGPTNVDVFGDSSSVVDLSETDFAFGLTLGAIASRSGDTQIVPSASLSFAHGTVTTTDGMSGTSDSESESFGLLGLGIGFVFHRVVTFRPGLAVPLGIDGATTTFTVAVGMNFGGSTR